MKLIKAYANYILTPLETEVKRLQTKMYKNKTFSNKEIAKDYWEKFDDLLFNYYKKFETLVDEKIKSNIYNNGKD